MYKRQKKGHADREGGLHARVALPLTQPTGPHSVARSLATRLQPPRLATHMPAQKTVNSKKKGHYADREGGLHAWVALPLTQPTGPFKGHSFLYQRHISYKLKYP